MKFKTIYSIFKIYNNIFDNGALIPKLHNIPLASCFFTNLPFLFSQLEHFTLFVFTTRTF